MATKVYDTIFKLRRANAAQWPDDYVLQEGEPGFEIDTGKLKIGNGVTTWENLDYVTNLTLISNEIGNSKDERDIIQVLLGEDAFNDFKNAYENLKNIMLKNKVSGNNLNLS